MNISTSIPVFVRYLQVEKKYSQHTCDSYQKDIEQFSEFCLRTFDTEKWVDINHSFMRSWIVSMMSEGLTSTSVNRKISAMRSFYKWALKKKIVEKNPMIKIIAPKKSKQLPVIVSDANINRLLEKNIGEGGREEEYEFHRDHFIIQLLYSTGIRRAELVGLNIADINLARNEIRVTGKGNKTRSIPMTEMLKDAVLEYLGHRESHRIEDADALLLTEKGKRIYPRLIHNIVVQKLSAITTLSKKSPHVLRHSFATHMLDRGAELNAIKELLGHANLAATQVYTHNSIAKLKDTYAKSHPRSS
jgi:integrase/recombinase XerC